MWAAGSPPDDRKTRPTHGIIAGTLTLDGRPADQVTLTITANGPRKETRTVSTDGSGWFAAVSLEPGRYRVQVQDKKGIDVRTAVVVVTPGAITPVQLAAMTE